MGLPISYAPPSLYGVCIIIHINTWTESSFGILEDRWKQSKILETAIIGRFLFSIMETI